MRRSEHLLCIRDNDCLIASEIISSATDTSSYLELWAYYLSLQELTLTLKSHRYAQFCPCFHFSINSYVHPLCCGVYDQLT